MTKQKYGKPWLVDQDEFLRQILANAPQSILVLDRRGRSVFVNRVDPPTRLEDVIGKSIFKFIAPKFRPAFRRAFAHALLRGKVATIETMSNGPDRGWWENTMGPLRREGRVEAVISIAQPISERVRLDEAEKDLRRLRERFENVFNHSSDGMNVVDLDGRYLNVNPAYCRIVGYSKRELIGRKRFSDLTTPEHRSADMRRIRQMAKTGKSIVFEKSYKRRDGSIVPVLLTVFPLKDSSGRASSFGAIVRDLTERRRIEHQVYEAGAREQSRLGRDLHDGIGQYLTGIALMARSLQARLATLGLPAESREAARMSVAANAAVAQTRALAQGLIPTELNDGLRGALAVLASSSRTLFDASVTVACPDRLALGDPKVAVNLYRIAQEAVHNACRHGKARKISIRVAAGGKGSVTMWVLDDGAGLPRRVKPGLGLRTMAHRAQLLGGSLDIAARPRGGVSVVCRCSHALAD